MSQCSKSCCAHLMTLHIIACRVITLLKSTPMSLDWKRCTIFIYSCNKDIYIFQCMQDWMNTQTNGQIRAMYTDLHLGRRWLIQMGEAASRYGIRIQYCMSLPRHVLQSLEIPAVTEVMYNACSVCILDKLPYHILL